MGKAKKKVGSAPAVALESAGEIADFIKGIYSDLAPVAPGEDMSGSNVTAAALTDAELMKLDRVVSLMGEKERSRSSVIRVALRRLFAEAELIGVFADVENA